jgi:hydroxylaminobenzene mutase
MKRSLLRSGMILFLLGLLTGLLLPQLHNPRAGLAAHLEGVMNGTFLVVVGLAWDELRLGEKTRNAAFALVLGGAYLNWATTLLTSVLGTSRATPIAGAGFSASAATETIVFGLFVVVALAMITAVSLFVAGFRDEAATAAAGTMPGSA